MAKDMLDAVFKTEEECRQRQAKARLQAEDRIKQTKADAKKLIDNIINESNKLSVELLTSVSKENDSQLESARQSAEDQCKKLSEIAEKNRSEVIKQAINILTE